MQHNATEASGVNFTSTVNPQISVLLIGEDKRFLHKLAGDILKMVKGVDAVNVSGELPRAKEMCSAIETCDSLLITAHLSTFGFWIGALMPENSPIYYLFNEIDTGSSPQSTENYPAHWIPLNI